MIDRDTPNARDGDRAAIGRCISGCVRAKDKRGHWQNELSCYRALLKSGTDASIAMLTAQAARRVGVAIAGMR